MARWITLPLKQELTDGTCMGCTVGVNAVAVIFPVRGVGSVTVTQSNQETCRARRTMRPSACVNQSGE